MKIEQIMKAWQPVLKDICEKYNYHVENFQKYFQFYLESTHFGKIPSLELYCYRKNLDARIKKNQQDYANEYTNIHCNIIPAYLSFASYCMMYSIQPMYEIPKINSDHDKLASKTIHYFKKHDVA